MSAAPLVKPVRFRFWKRKPKSNLPKSNLPKPHPGRPWRKLAGVWVAGELSELKKTIWLCNWCRRKFNHRKHNYHQVKRYPVTSNCDGCKAWVSSGLFLYHHESRVGKVPGTVYMPGRGE